MEKWIAARKSFSPTAQVYYIESFKGFQWKTRFVASVLVGSIGPMYLSSVTGNSNVLEGACCSQLDMIFVE